jgi:predicted nuclease of predicted toxin-antitoxin system
MARLFADEDFYYPVVEQLRALGHDVLTVQEAGQSGQGDVAILAFAVGQGRAVLTCNRRHFKRLHRQAAPHHGIVVCTRDNDYPALAARIHQAITAVPTLDNLLLSIIRPLTP